MMIEETVHKVIDGNDKEEGEIKETKRTKVGNMKKFSQIVAHKKEEGEIEDGADDLSNDL